jgi:phytol kinase
MILRLAVACFFVGSAIFFAEVARMNKWVSGERARKLIHIMVGVWGAWLPLWLGFRSIVVLGFLLLLGVLVSNKLRWFKSIHSVSRRTIGEYLFPISMILLGLFFRSPIAFAAAMLEMGVADGMAAVIGTRYGKKTTFKVIGNKKSWHGTATFFIISTTVIFWALCARGTTLWGISGELSYLVFAAVSLVFSTVLTVLELTGKHGFDNISVPIATAAFLTFFR